MSISLICLLFLIFIVILAVSIPYFNLVNFLIADIVFVILFAIFSVLDRYALNFIMTDSFISFNKYILQPIFDTGSINEIYIFNAMKGVFFLLFFASTVIISSIVIHFVRVGRNPTIKITAKHFLAHSAVSILTIALTGFIFLIFFSYIFGATNLEAGFMRGIFEEIVNWDIVGGRF